MLAAPALLGKAAPTLKEAIKDEGARQRYVERCFEGITLPPKTQVHYDGDDSKHWGITRVLSERLASDPQYHADLARRLPRSESLKELAVGWLKMTGRDPSDPLAILKDPELMPIFAKRALDIEKQRPTQNATTFIYGGDYGKRKPTTILFRSQMFEHITLKLAGHEYLIPPTDAFMRAVAHHEAEHARGFYGGITLPNGARLTGDNYWEVSGPVELLVTETPGYFAQVRHLKSVPPTIRIQGVSVDLARVLDTYVDHLGGAQLDVMEQPLTTVDRPLLRGVLPMVESLERDYFEYRQAATRHYLMRK